MAILVEALRGHVRDAEAVILTLNRRMAEAISEGNQTEISWQRFAPCITAARKSAAIASKFLEAAAIPHGAEVSLHLLTEQPTDRKT